MSSVNLTIAVPRGALMPGTLELLDRLGVDTSEVRANDRKLLFESVGIVTMRPSDVPTYVEAGAADIGICGKDVLMEQAGRQVYELLDLRLGPCVMVVASVAGEDRASEALRRLGVMRIATKYPRIATRHFERTGRQVQGGALYVTLDRLEKKGYVVSRMGDPDPQRSGRPKRFIEVTPEGVRALAEHREALLKAWEGIEPELDEA